MAVRNSREQLEIEYRRQCVKDIFIKLGAFDVTQVQIVEALKEDYKIKVDQSTISRDLAAIKKTMRQQTPDDLKAFLFAEYLWALRESRVGWRRSLEDAETTIQEMIDGGEPVKLDSKGLPLPVAQRLKASTRREGQSGNPALLAQAQAALKAIREMFGVDAPKKVDITWRDKVPPGYDPDEVKRQFVEMLKVAASQQKNRSPRGTDKIL